MKNFGYVSLGYLSLVALSLIDNGRGSVYPELLQYFQIRPDKGSLIFSLMSITSFIAYLTTSFWLPSFGPVKATRMAMVMMGIGTFGIGLGGDFLNFDLSLFFGAWAGFGFGITGITMNFMVDNGAPAEHKRRYLSGLHGVYGVASLMAPQILSLFYFLNSDWIHFFKFLLIPCALVFIYSFFVDDTHHEEIKENHGSMPNAFFMNLMIGLFAGFYVASEIMLSSRLKFYLVEAHEYSDIFANNYLSYFFLFLMLGRLGFAFLNIKLSSNRLIYISLVTSLICFSLGQFHHIFYPMTALFMSFCFPVIVDWVSNSFPKKNHVVLAQTMSYIGVSIAIMHFIFGAIADNYGAKNAINFFYFLNIGSIIFFTIAIAMVKKYHQKSSL
ncbi:MFS transporter [Halobacteriovorax sp. HFRX-2_2]|uniref:MFS transporter n=1 Tax=unclassified Halobacteriovorax TaxID=2639665 RepID=UPI00371066BC